MLFCGGVTATALRPLDQPPLFVYASEVHFDELDPMGILHNARYAVHVERATSALYESLGFRFEREVADNPDQFHVVRRIELDFHRPFVGTGPLQVRIWVDRLGETSCRYGFACISGDGVEHVTGLRTIVKLDPRSMRPLPWTTRFRESHSTARA